MLFLQRLRLSKTLFLKWKKPMINSAMNDSIEVVEEYQKEIMGSLDQLDDLLAFTEFKETQTDLIREIK